MVNGKWLFLKGRHEREIKGFKYYRSYVHVFMIWKGWYWLRFNYRSWEHIKNPRGTRSSGSQDVKHHQSLWVDVFIRHVFIKLVFFKKKNWISNFTRELLYETRFYMY